MNQTYEESALFEHKFWLKILGDHAQFLLDALTLKEKEDIQKAIDAREKEFLEFTSKLADTRKPTGQPRSY